MRTVKMPKVSLSRAWVALAVAGAALVAVIAALDVEAAGPLKIAFKLDPRLTYGLYMGDRWVAPLTFTQVQQFGNKLTVSARSHDAVSWSSGNASLVTVSPSVGKQVSIEVKRAGATTVTAGGAVLKVNAVQADTGVLVVQIQQ